jgi:hypothetical protein
MATDNTWIIGVVLIVLGSLGQNFGQNVVSLGHKDKDKVKPEEIKNDYALNDDNNDLGYCIENDKDKNENIVNNKKISTTNIGQIIFVTGALSTFAAFGFGSQSLLGKYIYYLILLLFCIFYNYFIFFYL